MILDESDPKVLADLVALSAARFKETGSGLTGQTKRPFHLGLELPVADLVAIMCNELLMHGWDIAAVTGNSMEAAEAAGPTLQHLSTVWPGFLRADLRAPEVFVHPFRSFPYTGSGVFVHRWVGVW